MASRYEIKNRLGTGGAGTVYRAWDTRLDRVVALKRLLTEFEAEEQIAMESDLLREASLLSSVTHPNVCQVYDFGTDEDGAYIVMEFLNGETLDRTAERGVSMQEFFGIAGQVLEGLAAAHEKRVLHRDIKPGNIMVHWLAGGKFLAKILDFGLAKFSRTPATQTMDHSAQTILGTVYFMAPEQFERKPLDARTDIYSMGCVLYFLLTNGRLPFGQGGSFAQIIEAHLQGSAIPAHHLRADAGPEVSQWLAWMMNRQPAARPQTAMQALKIFQRLAQNWQSPPAQAGPHPVQVVAPAAVPVAVISVPRPPSGAVRVPPALVRSTSAVRLPQSTQKRPTGPASIARTSETKPTSDEFSLAKRAAKKPVPWTMIISLLGVALTITAAIIVAKKTATPPAPPPPKSAALLQGKNTARYIRIELLKPGALTLAEVEVFSGGKNIAPLGSATQSSTGYGGEAQRAMDGNKDGLFAANGQTHTADTDPNPWWELDLKKEYLIDSVTVFNRTEPEYFSRLAGFSVSLLDSGKRVVFRKGDIPAPAISVEIKTKPQP